MSPRSQSHASNRSSSGLLAAVLLLFFWVGPTLAAGGTYDKEDPFDEQRRIERLTRLGWDFSKELDVEFYFDFKDRIETREHDAWIFARRLQGIGYPQAKAQPCANKMGCWLVIAPKRLRIDARKMIAMSKQLDQLAADDYGRYAGWECEAFRKEDETFLAGIPGAGSPAPTTLTPASLLSAFESMMGLQCLRIGENTEATAKQYDAAGKSYEAYSLRSFRDIVCNCVPERARQARMSLLPAERDVTLTEQEFNQRYGLAKIIEPCLAGMMRKTYGEDCPRLAAGLKANSPTYCTCMASVVATMSDAQITQLGLESADYLPLAAQAQKEGKNPAEPPALFKAFREKETACRK